MEIRTTVSLWKKVLGIANLATDDLRVQSVTGELYIREVDPAHVLLIQMHVKGGEGLVIKNPLPPTESGEPDFFVMNVPRVMNMLRRMRPTSNVTIEITKKKNKNAKGEDVEEDWMELECERFHFASWCPSKADLYSPKMPKLNAPNRLVLDLTPIRQFAKVVQDLGKDWIKMEVTKRGLALEAILEFEKVRLTIPYKEFSVWNFKEPTKSMFSLDYLGEILDQLQMPTVGELVLGNDFPITIGFGAHGAMISGEFLLAPRIEGE